MGGESSGEDKFQFLPPGVIFYMVGSLFSPYVSL